MAAAAAASAGGHLELRPDPFDPGSVELLIDGVEQSHVDHAHPDRLFYDYVRRIGTVLDLAAPVHEPITTLHLGAGALTLARYLQVTRPGSEQHAVELEPDLVPFVLGRLPLPRGTRLTAHTGDAAAVLTRSALGGPVDDASAAGPPPGHFDVVIADLYRGTVTPEHLRTAVFFELVAGHLTPDGILVVNVADDDGLPALTSLRAAIASTLPHGLVTGPASVLQDARAGNVVVIARRTPLPGSWRGALAAAGPHPAAVQEF
ncbi:MAG: fused MFS/spermidine synthase [Herbiconiux sp.]|nr:fused MFS/spermidine synthase [Herbiconiux sp.]